MTVSVDFRLPFVSAILGQVLHFIDMHIQETFEHYFPNSVTLTFTITGYVRGGWVPDITNYGVSAGLVLHRTYTQWYC